MAKETNSGNYNSGNYNSGNRNSGYCNSGNYNSGNYNSGNYNSGNRNSGSRNSGDGNSGDFNSGYFNSGYCNSGYFNSGNRNSGYYNSGDWNSGLFNTDEPKMRIFNKESDITMSEWIDSDDYIYFDLPLNECVSESDMTKEDKKENPGYKTVGGYLKTLEYKEAWAKWWENNEDKHDKVKRLPNFDAKIFKEITGIDVEEKEEMVKIEGKEYSASTVKKALQEYVK